jgi:hypothetical protein
MGTYLADSHGSVTMAVANATWPLRSSRLVSTAMATVVTSAAGSSG